jgi:ferredoxin
MIDNRINTSGSGVAGLRVHVNWEACESNGLCIIAAPAVFDFDEKENLQLVMPEPSEELRADVERAVTNCPKQAIWVSDEA